ncbi:MAG: hypothetical protein ABIG68_09770 [Acidobacteriota bacterium]
MNDIEAAQFIELEIRPRYRQLSETQASDWMRAVRGIDLGLAREIARELALDPDAMFTVKTFRKQVRARKVGRPQESVDVPAFDAWVRCIEAPPGHPGWENREWFRLEACDTFMRTDNTCVTAYAQHQAALVQTAEGGKWCGVVRQASSEPYTGPLTRHEVKREVETHVLDGPDGAGRRLLTRLRGKIAPANLIAALADKPPLPKIDKPAVKAEPLPKMFSKQPLSGPNPGPTRFDPATDAELQIGEKAPSIAQDGRTAIDPTDGPWESG